MALHSKHSSNYDSDSDSEPEFDRDMIPYSSAVVPVMPHTSTMSNLQAPSLPRPNLPTSPSGGFRTHGGTVMYVCCQCKDGPKIYDVQPKCIACSHEACSYCTYIK